MKELLIIVAIYFLPSMIAMWKLKKNMMKIFILNLFLGWTFIGWVIAFIWAV
ncbi:MAG: superinfection immunity protein [Candidatus Helarchaeota archaeon]